MKEINTDDVLENDRRWNYFKAGYEVGKKEGIEQLINSAKGAAQTYMSHAEREDPSMQAELVYENMCKLEVLDDSKEKRDAH